MRPPPPGPLIDQAERRISTHQADLEAIHSELPERISSELPSREDWRARKSRKAGSSHKPTALP